MGFDRIPHNPILWGAGSEVRQKFDVLLNFLGGDDIYNKTMNRISNFYQGG